MAASADSLLPAMRAAMPLSFETLNLGTGAAPMWLVTVDEVVGFAAPGGGNLAPPGEDAGVARMVAETDRLAKQFAASNGRSSLSSTVMNPASPSRPIRRIASAAAAKTNLWPNCAGSRASRKRL